MDYRHKLKGMKGYLTGPDVKELMYSIGYLAEALYQSTAPRDTGAMVASTAVNVEIRKPYEKGDDRYVAVLSVKAPYAVPVEWGHKTKFLVKGKPKHGRPVAAARALNKTVRSVKL